MVAGYAYRDSVTHHIYNQANNPWRVWTSIDQVSDKGEPTSLWMGYMAYSITVS